MATWKKLFPLFFLGLFAFTATPQAHALCGDLNRDGQVDVRDAAQALRGVVGFDALSPETTALGDLDGDDSLTVQDVISILRLAAGTLDGEDITCVEPSLLQSTNGQGLAITTFSVPPGTIELHLPDDAAAGDTISGTFGFEAKGSTQESYDRNFDLLKKYSLDINGQPVPVGQGWGKWILPPNVTSVSLILRDPDGGIALQTDLPILDAPPAFVIPTSSNGATFLGDSPLYKLPEIANQNTTVPVYGPFDGDISDSQVKLGDTLMTLLAESPRRLTFYLPNTLYGPVKISLKEGSQSADGDFHVLTMLLVYESIINIGESTNLDIMLGGLQGITVPVSLFLQNETPDIVSLEGGVSQQRVILPPEIKPDGTYTLARKVTALAPGIGDFLVLAMEADRPDPQLKKLKVDGDCSIVAVGASIPYTALGGEDPYTWTSSNEKIATVDKDGNVTGKAVGEATITAKDTKNREGSKAVTVIAELPKPTNLVAKVGGKETIQLTWDWDKANLKADGFEIERVQKTPKGDTVILNTSASAKPSYTDTKLNSGAEYCYRVRGYRLEGKNKCYFAWSDQVCATTDGCYMPKPDNLTAKVNCGAKCKDGKGPTTTLTWTYKDYDPKECKNQKPKFQVWRQIVNAGKKPNTSDWNNVATVTDTTYEDCTAQEGHDYYYVVNAILADNSRSKGAGVSAPIPPSDPTNLMIVRTFKGSGAKARPDGVKLWFTNNSKTADNFLVEYRKPGGDWIEFADYKLGKPLFTDNEGTGPGTSWEYRVTVRIGQNRPSCNPTDIAGYAEIKDPASIMQSQTKDNWCYAASLSMLAATQGLTISQETFVKHLYGDLRNVGCMTLDNLAKALNGVYDLPDGSKVNITGSVNLGQPNAARMQALIASIQAGKPFVLGALGHAVLCYGVVYTGTPPNATITEFLVIDPYWVWTPFPNAFRSIPPATLGMGKTEGTVEWVAVPVKK